MILNITQGTLDWHNARRGVLTASKFSRCITKTGNISKAGIRNVSQELMDDINRLPPKTIFSSDAMEYGNRAERTARCNYELKYNVQVSEVGFFIPNVQPFKDLKIGCSPDGMIEVDNGEYEGLEIKCPQIKTATNNYKSDMLPEMYRAQLQFSLFVTGWNKWNFYSWHDELPNIKFVEKPNYNYFEKIIEVTKTISKKIKGEINVEC